MNILKPYKYKQIEFFMADDISIPAFRDEVASMEHPFFALKGGDTKIREYKNRNVIIIVRPSAGIGLATIFDKDIWIYAISKLQEAKNNNKKISRTIAFTPYDFFITTNRSKSGIGYRELKKTLSRLSGTRIQTNIIYSKDKQEIEDFGLIDKWRILEEKKGKLDIGMIEITLPDWLYQAIKKTKILKINPDYFRIRKAINRRLYEIARKHCGKQNEFVIKLKNLHLKTGSNSNLAKFKFNIKKLVKINKLPDYKISYDKYNDNVIFTNLHKISEKSKKFFNFKKNNKLIYAKKNKIKKNSWYERNNRIKNIKQIYEYKLKIPKGFR